MLGPENHATCAVTAKGAVKCWGLVYEHLRPGWSPKDGPVSIPGLDMPIETLAIGSSHITSAGEALGSVIEELPGGAVVQIPVADFRAPKGASIEGHGVQPDRRVFETRAGLLAGHDVRLDAALEEAKASHPL